MVKFLIDVSLRVISGILKMSEFNFFEIYMFKIIKIVLMIQKTYDCQKKFHKNISLRGYFRNFPKSEFYFFEINYKDCSHDSKNILLLGEIPKKYKS